MSRPARLAVAAALICVPAPPLAAQSADSSRVLDAFESLGAWSARPSDGVALRIASGPGRQGRAMRLGFDFKGHGGYAIAHRPLGLDLPPNYELSFWTRGRGPPNNLEVKLVDSTGDNVWWVNRRDFDPPRAWRKITIKRRQLEFAWGPLGGGELRHAAALEFSVTAGQGGRGWLLIDGLTLTPREPDRPYDLAPRAEASSSADGHPAAAVLDGDSTTEWRSEAGSSARARLALDFLRRREYGGLVVEWAPGAAAADYDVETSDDGRLWARAYAVRGGNGGRDYIPLPESESRWLRLQVSNRATSVGVRSLEVKPLEWAATANEFFTAVARDAPPGSYPRYFAGQQVYWTIVGASGDGRRALVNEDGAIESRAGGFSVEPFLAVAGRLLSWRDAERTVRLEGGDLPIPTVEWRAGGLELEVTALAAGRPGASSLLARYRIRNPGSSPASPRLYLAVRPFQVNPPWQFLGVPGGAARVSRIHFDGRRVRVNGDAELRPTPRPAGFGASRFDGGEIVEHLRAGRLPGIRAVTDPAGHASAALEYRFHLAPGAAREVVLEIPFYPGAPARRWAAALAATTRGWRGALGGVAIELPPAAGELTATLRTTLAYLLINRDRAAIEPGARSYGRSWIRDGAMISAALLRLGQLEAVRSYLEWYAPYQYPGGKVPCCVDARGADPVPENDSHGELIYLVMEYYRHGGERSVLAHVWPRVAAAVGYIDSLRRSRMTPEYRTPDRQVFYGLMPQSISHEGYSAKPMHSYWDDFWTLRGLKDAAAMALVLGRRWEARRIAAIRDQFRRDLYASLQRAMAQHRIDYLPGAAELGDFDATSTTVALAPGGELGALPDPALRRTFERYWERFVARRDSAEWQDYTPYELRTVGTFLRLGWRDRAHRLLDWFQMHRRPPAWHAWGEVVYRDPLTPKFVGDLPHTWVGSDFARSLLDCFAWERERDSALVVGAGIVEPWVADSPGVRVRNLSTHYGRLSYTMREVGGSVRARIEGGIRLPSGGVVLLSPVDRPVRSAEVNGEPVEAGARDVVLRRLPADVIFRY